MASEVLLVMCSFALYAFFLSLFQQSMSGYKIAPTPQLVQQVILVVFVTTAILGTLNRC
jgi:hypothetical protein